MRTLCLIPESLAVMSGISGSELLGADAQMAWLGRPAQESALPAVSDSGPGQCSGSGATSFGAVLRGFRRTFSTRSGSSRESAMVNAFLFALPITCGWNWNWEIKKRK
jgi:hypothetical protein